MKIFLILISSVLTVKALSVQEEWEHFKIKHEKTYKDLQEEKLRFEIFRDNFEMIREHNAKYNAGLKTYWMGINKFADKTKTEIKVILGLQNQKERRMQGFVHVSEDAAPESIDWREKNAVTPVRDQESCGSCWAFSAAGSIEGQNAIVNNKTVVLSVQQLVDCSSYFGNMGCSGGNVYLAFEYGITNPIEPDSLYPYIGRESECFDTHESGVQLMGFRILNPNEDDLKNAVGTVGPVSAGMYADPIIFYAGGIFQEDDCINEEYMLNHGVLIVGYGIEDNEKFWNIKNSWGEDWGENGYLRLARDKSQCGIALSAVYPFIKEDEV